MTTAKALTRLIACSPPLFAALPLHRSRCIMATRVAIDVLARFNIAAEPRAVSIAVANAAYVAWRSRVLEAQRQALPEPLPTPGAWCVHAGLPLPDDEPPPEGGWPGHLVAYVPSKAEILDLDFQAFARPLKALDVPPAIRGSWPTADAAVTFTARDRRGHRFYAHYAREDANQGFRIAPDWKSDRPLIRDVVCALERAIRKDHR